MVPSRGAFPHLALAGAVAVALLGVASGSGRARGAALTPELEQKIEQAGPGETIPVILNFADQVDLSRFPDGRASAGAMIAALHEKAESTQRRVLAFLGSRGLADHAKSFWICNSIALGADRDLLAELSAFDEVETIGFDAPGGVPDVERRREPENESTTHWNMDRIRAPEVWATYGLDGTGIVIGSMDTGADIDHPALQGKWRGGTNSWKDIVGNQPSPYDDNGHGSHTIGTLVGGDGPGPFTEDIGLAYGAQFISAKVLDFNNSFSTASIVIAGAQWMLDPDGDPETDDFPHVINNSWLFFSMTDTSFHGSVAAWRAAGIIPVFCIANEGPAPASTRPPGNFNNTIGVGATDVTDTIALFSSRGPSPPGAQFPADMRKPDLSAPGDLVRSSVPGGGYAEFSGTSMASPHVAATAALMLELVPTLTYDEIRASLLATSVDLGLPDYDFDYGYGRLDAFEAITAILSQIAILPGPGAAPAAVHLNARPNPFSERVQIDFTAGDGRQAPSLKIFDIQGRLLRAYQPLAASGSLFWDGRDQEGRALPRGMYFLELRSAGGGARERLVLLR